jgi:hypothetical protein
MGTLKKIEIVVARFNENLEWINLPPFNKYNIKCYNKGNDNNFNIQYPHEIFKLDNVGRCDHTYLYHIVNNYDNLKDYTVFLPGSNDISYKLAKSTLIMEEIEKKDKTIFIGSRFNNVKDYYYNFSLDEYKGTYLANYTLQEDNIDNYYVGKSPIRPFGKWYNYHFGDRVTTFASFWGIFSLSRENIIKQPKEYYETFLRELEGSSNPEVGHYIERSWCAIFFPLLDTIYIENELEVNINAIETIDSFSVNNPMYVKTDDQYDTYDKTDPLYGIPSIVPHDVDPNVDPFVEYDYAILINLGLMPTMSSINDITQIFSNASFMQDPTDMNNTQVNLTISHSYDFLNWKTLFNNKPLATLTSGKATVGFSTLNPNTPQPIGDRFLEIIAHKLFGHGQSYAAIGNQPDFYTHDSLLWNHLSRTLSTTEFANDVYSQYIKTGRYVSMNTCESTTLNTWIPFNFINLSFDFPMYLAGSLETSFAGLKINGPNVGGSLLVNSTYNIPLVIRFHT